MVRGQFDARTSGVSKRGEINDDGGAFFPLFLPFRGHAECNVDSIKKLHL